MLLQLWDAAGIDRVECWCTNTRAIARPVYSGRDCNHQTGKSSQRSRKLKILRQRFRFMLCPHPPGVSSKPFSRPQKVPRLNVTLADRCTRKKVDRGGFFCAEKVREPAALGRASNLSEKTSSGSLLTGRSCLTRDLGASWQEEETATWRKVLHCSRTGFDSKLLLICVKVL